MNLKHIIILLVFSFVLFSCNDENPDLVNPPDKTGSIRYRFLNLGLDRQSKEMKVGESKITPSISWGMISPTDNPAADTGFIQIFRSGVVEYEPSTLVRFIRNTNYTYFGLSSHICSDKSTCRIDTVIGIRTTSAVPENNFESLLKYFNAYPDTTVRISIREGCPNGNLLFSSLNYKQYSISPITVRAGDLNFSVVVSKIGPTGNKDSTLNLYSVNLVPKGQYTLIAHEDSKGEITISILDENDLSTNALKPAQIVPEKITEIRTINISNSDILVKRRNGDDLTSNVSTMYIDKFSTISACMSAFQDTLDIMSSNLVKSSINTSLDVLSRYTLIVYDSVNKEAGGAILLGAPKLNVDSKGKAVVRIVNTVNSNDGINVSVGARKENDLTTFPSGFSSGISLARQLKFQNVSPFSVVNPGPAPISVFTSANPSRLLFATNTYFEADKEYIIIVTKDENDNIKLTMIDEDDESQNISFLEKGVFLQIVNSTSDNSSIKIDLNSKITGKPILENADLHITNSLATVLDSGNQVITINGQQYTSNASTNERIMVIAGGKNADMRVLVNKFEPLNENNKFRVRFVNATYDVPLINLKKSNSDSTYFESVEINTFSSYNVENREQKPAFFFYEGDNTNTIGRFSDVTMSLGKSFCIIIYGHSSRDCIKYADSKLGVEPNCYSFIIQQEF